MTVRKKITTKKAKTPRAPRKPRVKKLRLTLDERRLLEHIPTPRTWICEHHESPLANAGYSLQCVFCNRPKPSKPVLLWPKYVELCKRVGIEEGYSWKEKEDGTPVMRKKGESWKPVPSKEDLTSAESLV